MGHAQKRRILAAVEVGFEGRGGPENAERREQWGVEQNPARGDVVRDAARVRCHRRPGKHSHSTQSQTVTAHSHSTVTAQLQHGHSTNSGPQLVSADTADLKGTTRGLQPHSMRPPGPGAV